MAKREGYGRYQGRKSSGVKSFLKGVIVALILLLLLLLAAGIFLQDYIVYTDNGVKLILPWAEETAETPPPESETRVPIIIEDGPDAGNTEETETPSEEPVPDLSGPLHAVLVSQTSLLAGSAAEQVTLAGGNAVVLDMKTDDGMLNYVSDVRLAIAAETSGADPAVNEAIRALTEGELYTVARVSCFRDDRMCRRRSDLAVLTSGGYLWLDHDDTRWISPIQPEVTEYLTAVCTELAALGFDEILLTNCGYPGHPYDQLHWIAGGNAYPEDGLLEPVIADFLNALRAGLEPYGVKLSVAASGRELVGETALTGLTMNNVLAHCDRFWVDGAEAEQYANFAAAGGGTDPAEKLVITAAEAGEASTAWAILD